MLAQNVGKELPLYAAWDPRGAQVSTVSSFTLDISVLVVCLMQLSPFYSLYVVIGFYIVFAVHSLCYSVPSYTSKANARLEEEYTK
jgi:hypothetical protein